MFLPENGGTSFDHCQEKGGDGFIHEDNRSSSESESDIGMSLHPCMHAEEILYFSATNLLCIHTHLLLMAVIQSLSGSQ